MSDPKHSSASDGDVNQSYQLERDLYTLLGKSLTWPLLGELRIHDPEALKKESRDYFFCSLTHVLVESPHFRSENTILSGLWGG